jgi:putative ABC transport system permease protein
LDTKYALQHDVAVGDSIEVTFYEKSATLKVAGIILAPDRIHFTGLQEFLSPDPSLFGYGIISDSVLTELGYQGSPNLLEIVGSGSSVRDASPLILGDRYISYFDRDTLPEVSTAINRVGQIRNLSIMFSLLFILLSMLAMYTTIKRLIETQSLDISTLKALGFSNRAIGLYYASFGILIGGVGAILGAAVAPGMSLFVLESQKPAFSLPEWSINYTLATPGIIILIIFICILAAFMASSKARHSIPAAFMQNNSGASHRTLLERVTWIWKRFKFGSRWAWRDATANPARVVMGIISVCGSMMALMAGFGAPDSINSLVTDTFTKEFSYSARVKINPTSPEQRLLLQEEYGGQWLQSVPTRITPDDGYDRVLTIIGDGNYVNLVTLDGSDIQDGGVYVTEGAAGRLSIVVGQSITITAPLDTKKYEFEVKGIVASSVPQGVYITENTWIDAEGRFVPLDMLVGSDVSVESLKNDKRISQVIAIDDQKENINTFIGDLTGIFMLIRGFAIILAVVVLYNLSALSFTERLRSYTTLRVLGYHRKEIRRLAMRENITTTLVGWLIGIPCGFWFLSTYVGTFSTYSLVYYPNITILSIIIASVIAILCSLTTTFLIGRRIQKIDMVEATKGIE